MKGNHLPALSKNLEDLHSSSYEKFIILVDFNVEMEEQSFYVKQYVVVLHCEFE